MRMLILLIIILIIFCSNNTVFDNYMLNDIIENFDIERYTRYIEDNIDFTIHFISEDSFYIDLTSYRNLIKYIRHYEKLYKGISPKDSLIYTNSLNIIDKEYKIREMYNYTCTLCGLDCHNKDILDVHLNKIKNIITNKDIVVCCRQCHYNIDPKTHFNLL